MATQIIHRAARFHWLGLAIAVMFASSAVAQDRFFDAQGRAFEGAEGRPQRIRGVVLSVAADRKSFNVVDRAGVIVPVKLLPGTLFRGERGEAGFDEVVKFGMEVRVNFGADGAVSDVVARGMPDLELSQLQPFLGASDAEWTLLKPKIERVRLLQDRLDGDEENDNPQQGNAAQPARNPVRENQSKLETTFFDQTATVDRITANLAAYRDAKAKVRSDLVEARKELTQLLTVRQELLLVVMGILE